MVYGQQVFKFMLGHLTGINGIIYQRIVTYAGFAAEIYFIKVNNFLQWKQAVSSPVHDFPLQECTMSAVATHR